MIEFIHELQLRNPELFWFGAFNILIATLLFVLIPFVRIKILGIHGFIKPIKFALSIAIYSFSMAWFMNYLKEVDLSWMNWSIIILLGFEILYIVFQAARAQLSHFNISSPLYSLLYGLMAIAASSVSIITAYVGVRFLQQDNSFLPSYYEWSIHGGIWLFVIFSFQGFAMGSRLSHTIGEKDGGKGIPFFNWSINAGDLRIAHFIGMHALQLIPLLSFYILKDTATTGLLIVVYAILSFLSWYMAVKGKSPFTML